MSAISVTINGDSPAEVATRCRALADALARPTATPPATTGNGGGLPAVPSGPAPRVCSVHNELLRFDTWTAKSGKDCRAWRCPQSTPDSRCTTLHRLRHGVTEHPLPGVRTGRGPTPATQPDPPGP